MNQINKDERRKLVEAMEYITYYINDEFIAPEWLTYGVADGDIPYGYFGGDDFTDEIIDSYIKDDNLADLMGTFLHIMFRAYKSGGLSCNGVSSSSI